MSQNQFTLIQDFFTRMKCHHCTHHFDSKGIELLREEQGVFLVNVFCKHCDRQVGVAMVGIEDGTDRIYDASSALLDGHQRITRRHKALMHKRYVLKDPELTQADKKRLRQYDSITDDDVLDAHYFIDSLGKDWLKHIPEEMRQLDIEPQMEDSADVATS